MTRKTVTIVTCDKCGKDESDGRHIRLFGIRGDKVAQKIHFDLCEDCMVECLDLYFDLYSETTMKSKFGINISI